MADPIQIRQGINYIGYHGSIEELMSQYDANLRIIRSATTQGKRFPSPQSDPLDVGVFIPGAPGISTLSSFEPTKSYQVNALNAFTITVPGETDKLNQIYLINPPKPTIFNGQQLSHSFINVISFDNTILRTPVSACIVPRSNAFNLFITEQQPNGTSKSWIGSLFFAGGANPTSDLNANSQNSFTHFSPGSSYFIFVNYAANPINSGQFPTTVTTISAGRLNDLSYLLTEGLDFITTESGDYIRVK